MSSREEFEAWFDMMQDAGERCGSSLGQWHRDLMESAWDASRDSSAYSDLLSALLAITSSGPDAIPIKEAFEMAHRAIERATWGKV